jgi:hypothetical protein
MYETPPNIEIVRRMIISAFTVGGGGVGLLAYRIARRMKRGTPMET